jgi:hypothetical protein
MLSLEVYFLICMECNLPVRLVLPIDNYYLLFICIFVRPLNKGSASSYWCFRVYAETQFSYTIDTLTYGYTNHRP